MICPHCKKQLKCTDSRETETNKRIRTYECLEEKGGCGFKENTEEKLSPKKECKDEQ